MPPVQSGNSAAMAKLREIVSKEHELTTMTLWFYGPMCCFIFLIVQCSYYNIVTPAKDAIMSPQPSLVRVVAETGRWIEIREQKSGCYICTMVLLVLGCLSCIANGATAASANGGAGVAVVLFIVAIYVFFGFYYTFQLNSYQTKTREELRAAFSAVRQELGPSHGVAGGMPGGFGAPTYPASPASNWCCSAPRFSCSHATPATATC